MKSYLKIIPILIVFEIIFAYSTIIDSNLHFYNNRISIDNDNLRSAEVSGKISISGNYEWDLFKTAGNCTGEGTYSNPYVIEDLIIDGGGSGNCIEIQGSNVFFRIENCTLCNSGPSDHGIDIYSVSNGQIINNDCFSTYGGILVSYSNNNTLFGNRVNNNDRYGIRVSYSNWNNVSGNTVNKNGVEGIRIGWSNNNTISNNIVKDQPYGLTLTISDYNIITGNKIIGNDYCIDEYDCEGNIFENNDCGGKTSVPGYNLIFIFSTLSIVSILIIMKMKKS